MTAMKKHLSGYKAWKQHKKHMLISRHGLTRKAYLKEKRSLARLRKQTDKAYNDWQSQRYKEGIWFKPLSSVRTRNYIRRCKLKGIELTKRYIEK